MVASRGKSNDGDDQSTDPHRMEVILKTLLDEHSTRLHNSYQQQGVTITENAKAISDLNDMILGVSLQLNKLVMDGKPTDEQPNGHTSSSHLHSTSEKTHYHQYSARLTKVDFPKFDGVDLKSWLYKCVQFFDLDGVQDPDRVKLAVIHLEGKALLWHKTYIKRHDNALPSWNQYVEDITARFGELYDDPMADLKALLQTGTVQEYHDQFDALASRLNLSEEHLLSCYVGGLEQEIQMVVRMFNLKSVQQALCLAKLQEAGVKARKSKMQMKGPLLPTLNTKILTPPTNFPRANTAPKNSVNTQTNRRTLTSAEYNEKRAKGICFWCDAKYEPGHKCRGKKP